MKNILVFVAALVSANIPERAASEIVSRVTTGEHIEFTRVVIPLPQRAIWNIKQNARHVIFEIENEDLTYDITDSFLKISRERVAELSATKSRLEITLGCDCILRAAVDVPNFLVIDIFDDYPELSDPSEIVKNVAVKDSDFFRILEISGEVTARMLRENLSPFREITFKNDSSSMSILESFPAIGQDLSKTSSVGLQLLYNDFLSGDLISLLENSTTRSLPHPPIGTSEGSAEGSHDLMEVDVMLRQHIALPVDHYSRSNGFTFSETSLVSDICPSNDIFSPYFWVSNQTRQSESASEDLYDESFVLALYFLTKGFGAEARVLLQFHMEPSVEKELLLEISSLIDSEFNDIAKITDFTNCSDFAALWSFLAQPVDNFPMEFPIERAVRAALSLPEPLRTSITPSILAKLLDHGFFRHALSVYTSLDATGAKFTNLELDTDIDSLSNGLLRYSNFLLKDDRILSDASNVARGLDDTSLVSESVDEVSALAYLMRGSLDGYQIIQDLVRSLVASRQYISAFSVFVEHSSYLSFSQRYALSEIFLQPFIQDSSDAEFLRVTFSSDFLQLVFSENNFSLIASRLANLGFSNIAQNVLADLPRFDGNFESVLVGDALENSTIMGRDFSAEQVETAQRRGFVPFQVEDSSLVSDGATVEANTRSNSLVTSIGDVIASSSLLTPASRAIQRPTPLEDIGSGRVGSADMGAQPVEQSRESSLNVEPDLQGLERSRTSAESTDDTALLMEASVERNSNQNSTALEAGFDVLTSSAELRAQIEAEIFSNR